MTESPELPDEEKRSITAAIRRGNRYRESLLKRTGGALSEADAAKLLRVSTEAVRERIHDRSLIGILTDTEWKVPAAQFDAGQELRGLRQVLRLIPMASPWGRLDWLTSPEPRLNGKVPAEALRDGVDPAEIVAAASLLGVHGAQ